MKCLNIPLIFAGFGLLRRYACQQHILYYILWVQEEEKRARLASPAEKKIVDAAGIVPATSR
jgi:hypothetical protein